MDNSNIKSGITVKTPDGKAKVSVVDFINSCVRVEHLEARTPITDYRFSDIEILCGVCQNENAVNNYKCTTCYYDCP